MKYVNLKNGKTYEVVSFDAINATNAQDGQRMVVYIGEQANEIKKGVFVREYNEFMTKFVPER